MVILSHVVATREKAESGVSAVRNFTDRWRLITKNKGRVKYTVYLAKLATKAAIRRRLKFQYFTEGGITQCVRN